MSINPIDWNCGPFNRLREPTNKVDALCYIHDLQYAKLIKVFGKKYTYGYFNAADAQFLLNFHKYKDKMSFAERSRFYSTYFQVFKVKFNARFGWFSFRKLENMSKRQYEGWDLVDNIPIVNNLYWKFFDDRAAKRRAWLNDIERQMMEDDQKLYEPESGVSGIDQGMEPVKKPLFSRPDEFTEPPTCSSMDDPKRQPGMMAAKKVERKYVFTFI